MGDRSLEEPTVLHVRRIKSGRLVEVAGLQPAAFHKEILRNLEGSVRKYLFYENFSNIRLPVPPLPEQKKIAEILQQCDKVIELKQSKIEELQELKKTCLSKMFPKEGHNVPELRFSGFTDAWEQRKLGDRTDLLTGYPFESKQFVQEGIPLVRGINVKRGYLDMSDDICEHWNFSKEFESYLLQDQDIVIQMDGALIGRSYAMIRPENTPSLLVQRVTRVRCQHAEAKYIYQCFQRDFLNYIRGIKTETAVPHLSLNDIREYTIYVPTNKDEMSQVGEYFDTLDNLITLHQRELEETRKYKKVLMQLLLTGIVRVK